MSNLKWISADKDGLYMAAGGCRRYVRGGGVTRGQFVVVFLVCSADDAVHLFRRPKSCDCEDNSSCSDFFFFPLVRYCSDGWGGTEKRWLGSALSG